VLPGFCLMVHIAAARSAEGEAAWAPLHVFCRLGGAFFVNARP
jgi:hypothetical protein